MSGPILVVDIGTSSVRGSIVAADGTVAHEHRRATLPDSPMDGLVEFDARALADAAFEVAGAALSTGGPVAAVGIANQRASTVVWDRATGEPVGPALGWQDLRTIGACLAVREQGYRIAPNASATKLSHLLDEHDPDRSRDLCFGTVDTWIAWVLSGGALHVTDATNAGVTGLTSAAGDAWDPGVLAALRIPAGCLPAIVDSSGVVGAASALDGSPPIAGMAGDQQASLLGQGCIEPGVAKITFGTGGMLDMVLGPARPDFHPRGRAGCFPIVARRVAGATTWGIEAVMLSAGTNIEWLRDDLGLLATAEASHEVAASVPDSGGAWYVPALLGLGTPQWDYGARGTLLGITRGTTAAHVVRAVLEGIAHRGADLVEAAAADGGHPIDVLRIDGGMAANPTFVQALADATQRRVEVSPVLEATTLGAAFLAGLAIGTWGSLVEAASTWRPALVVEPGPPTDRARWAQAIERAAGWIPELSAFDF
ncbi:MAG: glycerol kinase [Acidimicrobiia bacterium]|nr:glycerol kinase [Acidimicrobiia bacterium]